MHKRIHTTKTRTRTDTKRPKLIKHVALCSFSTAILPIVAFWGGRYRWSFVPDEAAANVVSVNGALLRRSAKEFPASDAALRLIGGKQVQLEASELGKVDGALSCCSLLF